MKVKYIDFCSVNCLSAELMNKTTIVDEDEKAVKA